MLDHTLCEGVPVLQTPQLTYKTPEKYHATEQLVHYPEDNIISGILVCACASRPNEILLVSMYDNYIFLY